MVIRMEKVHYYNNDLIIVDNYKLLNHNNMYINSKSREMLHVMLHYLY